MAAANSFTVMSLRYKGNSIFFLSTTAVRLRLCSLVTVAKNRGAKFRENQLLSCKICHKYTYHCTSSVSNMIDQLGWQDLETRRQNFRSSLLFKIVHDQTCIPLSDITPPTIITSSTIVTRSDLNNLPVPFARTDTYKFSVEPHACNI